MTYENIREAAEARTTAEATGAWRLADALVAEVPNNLGHNQHAAEGSSDVTTSLAAIAERLEADGIETPRGEAYTPASLRELRLVAMGWPAEQRLPEAAFRTHQEAGTTDEWRREVLRTLCLAARERDWEQPPLNHGEVDPQAWVKAIASVRRKTERGSRYPVAANDLRVAIKRRVNIPQPGKPLDQATPVDAVEYLQEAGEKIRDAVAVLSRDGAHLGEVRGMLQDYRALLDSALGLLDALLSGGGMSDDALSAFIEGRQ